MPTLIPTSAPTCTAAHYAVNFRTLSAGSYKWLKGATRGYYQLVECEPGARGEDLRYRGVTLVGRTHDGISGVTPRSRYYIEDSASHLRAEAARLNDIARGRITGCAS